MKAGLMGSGRRFAVENAVGPEDDDEGDDVKDHELGVKRTSGTFWAGVGMESFTDGEEDAEEDEGEELGTEAEGGCLGIGAGFGTERGVECIGLEGVGVEGLFLGLGIVSGSWRCDGHGCVGSDYGESERSGRKLLGGIHQGNKCRLYRIVFMLFP